MKLHTDIQPRADGTITVHGEGKDFIFNPNDDGVLEADVDQPELVEQLIQGENFWPADVSDADASLAILGLSNNDRHPAETRNQPIDDMSENESSVDAEISAMPIEANTPPKPPKTGRGKGRPRRVN